MNEADNIDVKPSIVAGNKNSSSSMVAYNNNKKLMVISYILWLFLGVLGAHRFYLRSYVIAIIMLICTLGAFALPQLIFITIFIKIFDLVYIPFMVKKLNNNLMDSLDLSVEEKLKILKNSPNSGVVIAIVAFLALIVIGGILAAVVIPRLAATRDDAYVAKALVELNMAFRDSNMYYVEKEKFGSISDMTSIKFDSDGDASLKEVSVNYITGKEKEYACVNFTYKPNGILIVSAIVKSNSRVCKEIFTQPGFKKIEGEHSFEER